jgi:tRNA(adenine34) deaminase
LLTDVEYMEQALLLAQRAFGQGEVPVGAIVVNEHGYVCGEGYNLRESQQKPTAHAEIIAIEAAAKKLGQWRLTNCTLYVTLEPCLMCAGAIVNSRIKKVVFGAHDPKAGATGSLFNINSDERLNHRFEVVSGVGAEASQMLLQTFFAQLRQKKTDFK